MSTLPVVEEILRETEEPMSVRQIVEHAGARLPTRSKTPDTVVARDLSMDIKKKGEASLFIRTSPGRYTIREIHMRKQREARAADQTRSVDVAAQSVADTSVATRPAAPTPVLASAIQQDRAAALSVRKPAEPSEEHKTAG